MHVQIGVDMIGDEWLGSIRQIRAVNPRYCKVACGREPVEGQTDQIPVGDDQRFRDADNVV